MINNNKTLFDRELMIYTYIIIGVDITLIIFELDELTM